MATQSDELISNFIDRTGVLSDKEFMLVQLNELYAAYKKLANTKINLDGVSTWRAATAAVKELQEAEARLAKTKADMESATTRATAGTKNAVDAYTLLNQQYKEADRYAKNQAAIYGAQTEQAKEAAAAALILKQRLQEVNSVTKPQASNSNNPVISNDVSNPAAALRIKQIKEEEQADIELAKSKDFLIAKDAELSAAIESTAAAQNQSTKLVKTSIEETASEYAGVSLALDEYTGTLHENLLMQIENEQAIAANRAEQTTINKAIKDSGIATQEQISNLARLQAEELSLVDTNRNLSTTVRNQIKDFNSAEGSIDKLRAHVALLNQSYTELGAAGQKSSKGLAIKAQLDQLVPTLKTAEGQIGNFTRDVGNYGGAVAKGVSSVFGYIRQLAYLIPGIGIAGIFSAAIDPIVNTVKELIGYESAEDRAKRATAALTEELKFQNEELGRNKTAIKQTSDEIIADLKLRGATQDELNEAEKAGLFRQQKATEEAGGQTIENINKQISSIDELKAKLTALKEVSGGVGSLGGILKFNVEKLSSGDVQNIDKITSLLKTVSDFKTSKEFAKLPEEFKSLVSNLELTGNDLSKNANDALALFNQRKTKTVQQIAQDAEEQRAADRKSAENSINTQSEIIERNKKAKLDEIAFTKEVRIRDFNALKAQITAQENFELNAESDKIAKINSLRSIKLSQPELSAAQRQQINSDADREIASARLTEEQRIAIRKKYNAQRLDLDKEFFLREAEAEKERFVQEKQYQADHEKELTGIKELSLSDRLGYEQKYFEDQKAIIEKEFELRKKQDQFKSLTPEEKLREEKDYETKLFQLILQTQKGISDILSKEVEIRQGLLKKDADEVQRIYSRINLTDSTQYSKDVIALNESLSNKEISLFEYNKRRSNLDYEYGQKAVKNLQDQLSTELSLYDGAEARLAAAQLRLSQLQDKLGTAQTDEQKIALVGKINTAQKEVDVAQDNVDKKLELEGKLTEGTNKESDDRTNHDIDNTKKRFNELAEAIGKYTELFQQATALSDAQSDRKIQAIQDEQAALEERYQAEIDLINATYTSQTDRDQKLKEAAARNAAQKRTLEAQEKQAKLEKARFDKEATIFSIILNTAKAVAEDLGGPQAAFKIPFDLAIGAAELAVAIATPLPRFFKGKNAADNYEGYGIVDDGPDGRGNKPELIIREDGSMEVGTNQPRVTYLSKNDIVIPDATQAFKYNLPKIPQTNVLMAIAMKETEKVLQYSVNMKQVQQIEVQQLSDDINTMRKELVNAVKNIPQPNIKVEGVLDKWLRGQGSIDNYL